jgi:hypothetical protein
VDRWKKTFVAGINSVTLWDNFSSNKFFDEKKSNLLFLMIKFLKKKTFGCAERKIPTQGFSNDILEKKFVCQNEQS